LPESCSVEGEMTVYSKEGRREEVGKARKEERSRKRGMNRYKQKRKK